MKIKMLVLTLTLGLAAAGICMAGDTKAEQSLRSPGFPSVHHIRGIRVIHGQKQKH